MVGSTCFGSLQACMLRVAKLDSSGKALAGAANGYVTDALISVQISVNNQAGDEFIQKNGCGAIDQYFKDCDHIKNLTFTMNLCQLDSELLAMLMSSNAFVSGGNAIGWQYPGVADACPNGVSLEVWTKAWDGTSVALPAFTTPNAAYWHWVFPRTTWTLGNVQMDNSIMVVPVTGIGQENSAISADGPFNDWPAAIAAAGGVTKVGGVFLDATIPTAACNTIAVPTAS